MPFPSYLVACISNAKGPVYKIRHQKKIYVIRSQIISYSKYATRTACESRWKSILEMYTPLFYSCREFVSAKLVEQPVQRVPTHSQQTANNSEINRSHDILRQFHSKRKQRELLCHFFMTKYQKF
jgi:hypothetical protein